MRKWLLILILFNCKLGFSQLTIAFNQSDFVRDNITTINIDLSDSGRVIIIPIGSGVHYSVKRDSVYKYSDKTDIDYLFDRRSDILGKQSIDSLKRKIILPKEYVGVVSYKFEGINDTNVHVKFAKGSNSNLELSDCSITELIVERCSSLHLQNSKVDNLHITNSDSVIVGMNRLPNIRGEHDVPFKHLNAVNCSFKGLGVYSDTLDFNKCSFSDEVDFNFFHFTDKVSVALGFNVVDISKLNFDRQDFKLDTSYTDYESTISMINSIKDMQENRHYEKGYELTDKDLMQFQYLNDPTGIKFIGKIKNCISSWWWDYGYEKGKVVLNSLYLMLVFFVINLFFFKKLWITYPVKSLVDAVKGNDSFYLRGKPIHYIKNVFYCFFYTGIIFWGIRFDFEKVNMKNIGLVILVIVEYTTGIVCLAYIANYIIVR